jgi:hypothetical protein
MYLLSVVRINLRCHCLHRVLAVLDLVPSPSLRLSPSASTVGSRLFVAIAISVDSILRVRVLDIVGV